MSGDAGDAPVGSVTNGWDAVCAVNAAQISALFFQQYLQDGPTSPARPLRAIVPVGQVYACVDFVLGPPDISFSSNLPAGQCQLQMFLQRGELIQFDPHAQTIASAIKIRPNASQLTGSLNLTKVAGQVNQLGTIVVDLGSGAYQPTIEGVDPASAMATAIGDAIQTFFATNAVHYPMGVVALSSAPACLQPTDFDIAVQPNPQASGDGCVLLLIKTNGAGGTVGALSTYPIPAGSTAALIVSSQALFCGVMPGFLQQELPSSGATFQGTPVSTWNDPPGPDGYLTLTHGGALNTGIMGSSSSNVWSTDKDGNQEPIMAPLDGFIVGATNGTLQSGWFPVWDQHFSYTEWVGVKGGAYPETYTSHANLKASYIASSTPTVDPTTDVVSFSGSPGTVTLHASDDHDIWKRVEGANIPDQLVAAIQNTLQSICNEFKLPDVDTFALANLLFPLQHVLSLQQASIPCDLTLSGQLNPVLVVTPASVTLTPGTSQTFAATINGQPATGVLWAFKGVGSISPSGVYTAPSSVAQPEVVIVTATNTNNTAQVGSAMAIVYDPPAGNLVVSPGEVILTAGQTFDFMVLDNQGNPVAATCTIGSAPGSIAQGTAAGQWTYSAPATVSAHQNVTLTATSSGTPALTGAATIQLAVSSQIVMPPAVTVPVNGNCALSAQADEVGELTWVVYPTGSGTVTPNPSDSTQATYNAPASIDPNNNSVMVAAYSLGDTVGIGITTITVTSGT